MVISTGVSVFGNKRKYKYHVERISPSHIEGWVYNQKHNKPCRVEFKTTDLVTVASGDADLPQPAKGGRRCGFKLTIRGDILETLPIRLLLFADGVKLANNHVILPFSYDGEKVAREMEARADALACLSVERLQIEIAALNRRIAELEREGAEEA